MDSAVLEDALSQLERIRHNYLNNGGQPEPDSSRQWQPRSGLWNQLQDMTRLLPGLHTETVTVDGHRIRYWRLGSGDNTPVVLLHGFGAGKESWATLLPMLWQSNRSFYVLDLPGFGESTYRHDASYRYGAQAQRMAEWARTIGLPAAHWVGSSMGGAICATLGAHHPERVATLTLMNAAGMGSAQLSPMERELVEGRNPLIPSSRGEVRKLFRITTYRNQRLISQAMTPALWREMTHRQPANRHIFADMLQPEEPVPKLLGQVSAPTLIIWGERDRIVDVSCAYRYSALLPNARVEVMRNVGHLPMLEVPMRCASLMKPFWKRAGSLPYQA